MQLTDEEWESMRADYESGLSQNKCAKQYGVTPAAVSVRRRKEGWVETKELDSDDDDEATTSYVDVDVNELLEQLDDLQKKRKADLEEIEKLKQAQVVNSPTADISHRLFRDVNDVFNLFSRSELEDMAQLKLTAENRQRMARNLPLRVLGSDELEAMITKLATQLVGDAERSRPKLRNAQGRPILFDRVIKMVFPKFTDSVGGELVEHECPHTVDLPPDVADRVGHSRGCYYHGDIRQIPLEEQINNGAGSLRDPIVRYQDKGAKIASPALCATKNCNRLAAIDPETGRYLYGGYCCIEHFKQTERNRHGDQSAARMLG
ncbi:MAG: hypothetical protein WC977_02420 [Anaerovoracaceae bacterium]|jgi:predicted transcriptional regulator